MKLFELAREEMATGYYDPAQDRVKTRHYGDTRKPRLTLAHLSKLKRMRALKKLENLKRQDLLGIMYGIPPEEMPGMGMGMGMGAPMGGGLGGGMGGGSDVPPPPSGGGGSF